MGLINIELYARVYSYRVKSNDLEPKEVVSISNIRGNRNTLETTIRNLLPY
jgi:hypothetical protein